MDFDYHKMIRNYLKQLYEQIRNTCSTINFTSLFLTLYRS
ncbi:MAG: hypothetical protein ACR5K4_02895 [Sodalis sp. (in: enterobacteria)]